MRTPWPLLALSLALLASWTAEARLSPRARERKERRLTLAGAPAELHVAEGHLTTVVFPRPLDRDSLVLEGAERFRLVDVGERSVLLEPLTDLAPGERLKLRLRYLGDAEEPLSLELVSHPSEVDSRVEVLSPHSVESLQARLAELERELATLRARLQASEPTDFILANLVGREGLRAHELSFPRQRRDEQGLQLIGAICYRARTWSVLSVRVFNPPGQGSWAPTSARLLRADGSPVEVRRVRMDRARLESATRGFVEMEMQPISPKEGPLRLELVDERSGQRLHETLGFTDSEP